jgi:glycosyltransferase involved in cell wall biosynthesis
MKISVITVCLNSQETIKYTLNSVLSQTYKNIEHIIVDGGSQDGTKDIIKNYKNKKKKLIFANRKNLYESLNIGIQKSTGNLISILHSDDIFNNIDTLSKVATIAKNSKQKIFFGDVVYFKNFDFKNVIRNYPANNFNKKSLMYGNMPPHTGSFYKKEIFYKHGFYKTDYKIAGDFEHLLRLIKIKNEDYKLLNLIVTRMRVGGLSGKNFNSFLIINKEILNSYKIHKIKSNMFKILLRVPPKIFQYIFLNNKKLNLNFNYKIDKTFNELSYNQLNIIQNIEKIDFSKNFILSALNLAFLGSLSENKIQLNENLINWPDGIFSKLYKKKITKIPGRQILKDLKLNSNIKKIIILGNLSKKGRIFLTNKFKIPIKQVPLPFGKVEEIVKKLHIKIKKDELIFLTLPTPKQEQIANFLRLTNKNYKIICIGGSIGIVSGDELEVPKYLYYFEFLWRLRYDSLRRLNRLIKTFYQYLADLLIYKKIKNIRIKLIN